MSTQPARSHASESVGTLLAAVGAFAYGITVVIGRRLAEHHVPPPTALGFRFAAAAAVLAIVLVARREPLVPTGAELIRFLLLGGIGYALESTFFFMSLQRGTAAAVALLFYAYPAIVCGIEIVRGHEAPSRSTLAALALAVAGTSLVALSGARLSISATGVGFALASAMTYAMYLLVGRVFGRDADAMTAAMWIAAGASLSNLARGVVTSQLTSPVPFAGLVVLYGAATAAAFALTFSALRHIGAARTAVVMTLEAVTAVVLGAIFLEERIGTVQMIGGAATLLAAGVIGRRTSMRRAAEQLHE